MGVFLTADMPFARRIARLKDILEKSGHAVFFGGAGVSTGSGIPDFRSPDGFYNNPPKEFGDHEPEYLLSHECLEKEPGVFFRFYRKYMDLRAYDPCTVHRCLRDLEDRGRIKVVITQNIDLLHEKAGTKNLIKLHGSIDRNYCEKCGSPFAPDFVFKSVSAVPRCFCGGVVRPDVTLYGEGLQAEAMSKAQAEIAAADCLIVCGTSLKVMPAAGLVSEYTGSYMVIINCEPTPYDQYADVVFHEDMNEVFRELMNVGVRRKEG